MRVVVGFVYLILATVSFVTTGVVAVVVASSLPEGLYTQITPIFIIISAFVTLAFGTWGLVDILWPPE